MSRTESRREEKREEERRTYLCVLRTCVHGVCVCVCVCMCSVRVLCARCCILI